MSSESKEEPLESQANSHNCRFRRTTMLSFYLFPVYFLAAKLAFQSWWWMILHLPAHCLPSALVQPIPQNKTNCQTFICVGVLLDFFLRSPTSTNLIHTTKTTRVAIGYIHWKHQQELG